MSILTALPGIRPTTRAFAMEEWPQGQAKSRSGRIVKWAQVSKPAGASLELAWENITYAQAQTLLDVWDANYGTYGTVDLVTETLAGLDAGLAALIDQPFTGATWRSEGPPIAEAVKARRCTVRLPLRTRQGAGGGTTPPSALRILQALSGVLTLTGGNATLRRSRKLTATPGSLEIVGGDATLRKVERYLQAGPGVLTLTGGGATLSKLGAVYSVAASPGALTLTGGDATLSVAPAGPAPTLLLHCDGTNGSTTFIDSSAANRTVSVFGGAEISTAQSKFGGASLLGSNSRLEVTVTGGLGAGAFTLDFWFRLNATGGLMFTSRDAGTGGIDIFCDGKVSTSGQWIFTDTPLSFNTGQWYHFAVTRDGSNTMRRFVDGVITTNGVTNNVTYNFTRTLFKIGGSNDNNVGYINGYMDEFRFVAGEAVWTANFTPPSSPYI